MVHRVLHQIAELERPVSRQEIGSLLEEELRRKPIDAPHQLARPVTHIRTNLVVGTALLPPLTWQLIGTELKLSSGSVVDQVYATATPTIIGDQIGDIVGVEIKLSASADTASLPSTRSQVASHLDGLLERFGDRLLGVATVCLGQPDSSILTLAADRTELPLARTPLWAYPVGRLAD